VIKFTPDFCRFLASHTRSAATPVLLLLMLRFASGPTAAQAADCPLRPVFETGANTATQVWSRVSEQGPVCVYTRESSRSNVHDVMATATIAAAPTRVFEVITNYASYPQFMPYVVASEVLRKEAGTQWVFQQLALPLMISDRYYTIRLSTDISFAAQNIYRINWTLAQGGEPVRRGRGEPTLVNDGSWELRPLAGDTGTQVVYFVHTDPGGALPGFIVNMANTIAVPSVIEAVRARVAVNRSQTTGNGR